MSNPGESLNGPGRHVSSQSRPRRGDAFLRHDGAFLRHYCAADASLTDAHAQGVDRRKDSDCTIRSPARAMATEQGRAGISEIDFYHAPQTRSETVLWMLEEVRVPYRMHVLDRATPECGHREVDWGRPAGKEIW
jgi:hypothetical protein